jgi:hypothetical protein
VLKIVALVLIADLRGIDAQALGLQVLLDKWGLDIGSRVREGEFDG